jgi:hypothetical protein
MGGDETLLHRHLTARLAGRKPDRPYTRKPEQGIPSRYSRNVRRLARAAWALDGCIDPLRDDFAEEQREGHQGEETLTTIYEDFDLLAMAAAWQVGLRAEAERWLADHLALLLAHETGGFVVGKRLAFGLHPGGRTAPHSVHQEEPEAEYYGEGVEALWRAGIHKAKPTPLAQVRLREPIVRLDLDGGGWASYMPTVTTWSDPVTAVLYHDGQAQWSVAQGILVWDGTGTKPGGARGRAVTVEEDGRRVSTAMTRMKKGRGVNGLWRAELALPGRVVGRTVIGGRAG